MRSLRAFVLIAVAAPLLQQGPDRAIAPKPGPLPALKLPAIQKRTLANGLPVWIVELHKVPVVHVSLVVKSGASADPNGKNGLANLTADMLDEGGGSRNALQIADAIDYLGATLSTESSFDASSVDLHVPVARLGDALPILSDVALRPTFPEAELKRVREDLLTTFVEAKDDPESLVQFAFPRLVFGPHHRYGTLSIGTPATVKSMTVADLRQLHSQHYVPSNSLLVITGDITAADVVRRLEPAFGAWKGATPSSPAISPGASVDVAADLPDRQTRGGAVADQNWIGWRAAIDA